EVFKLLKQARDLNVPNKDLSDLRREAVACLGDFVGLAPTTFTNFPSKPDITWIGFGPAGDLATFALANGTILLLEMPSGKEVTRLKGDYPPVSTCLSTDGSEMISVHAPDAPWTQEHFATSVLHIWTRAADGSWREAEKLAVPGAYQCLSSSNGVYVAVVDL